MIPVVRFNYKPNSSAGTASNTRTKFDLSVSNFSQNYWITISSLTTVNVSVNDAFGWLNNELLLSESVSSTISNVCDNLYSVRVCLNNVSTNYWSPKNTLNAVSRRLHTAASILKL